MSDFLAWLPPLADWLPPIVSFLFGWLGLKKPRSKYKRSRRAD